MYTQTKVWAVVGVFVVALLGGLNAAAQPVRVGQQFPDFEGEELLTGKEIALKQFRGKVVLIDFWATWCAPCIREIPNVKKVYSEYHKQGFEIISISLDQSKGVCERFVKLEKMNWHHIYDGEGRLARRYGVRGIPTMYLLGKDGRVVSNTARGRMLETAVRQALAEKGDGPAYAEVEGADQIERQAKADLAAADKLRAAGQYAEAVKKYDEIRLKYMGRPTAKLANERARLIRQNPDLEKELERAKRRPKKLDPEAAKTVQRWRRLADSFAKQENFKMARTYYEKIIDAYPDSKEAAVAKKALQKLPTRAQRRVAREKQEPTSKPAKAGGGEP